MPVALPVQDFDAVALPVHEHEQALAEGVELKLLLHLKRESPNRQPEVHRLVVQIDGHATLWTHHVREP